MAIIFSYVTKSGQMTNYAFQGVGALLKLTSALATHLIFAQGFWLKQSLFFVQIPQPKGVGLVIFARFVTYSYHFKNFSLKY